MAFAVQPRADLLGIAVVGFVDELGELSDQRAKVQKGRIAGDFEELALADDAFALEACVCQEAVDPVVRRLVHRGFCCTTAVPDAE